ncbi:HDOD domain-containing protein [Massilia sp. PWRC2]|uniref:HDOD domain-containing protein n=1 Tax=Massilia sp. PWRC2 TaxID=2804626 RepID=UPI003CEA20E9
MQQTDHDIRNRLLIARLPAMPQILIKLLEHLQADDLGMAELAALIANDAGMTAKILAVANSSAYHRVHRQVGLEPALMALGTDMIKTLVISESVFQTFSSFPHSGSTDLRGFWKSSLTAAVIARDVAKRIDYPHVEEAYLAGLLHNVGRLALLATAPKEYAFNFTARDDAALCAVEQRTLQITHSEAGAWLIERWHLDSFLADSVLYHHEPIERLEAAHPLIRIVRLAHLLGHLDDQDDQEDQDAQDGQDDSDAIIAAGAALCGLGVDDVLAIAAAAARQVEKSATHLGIDLTGADDAPTPPAYAPPADPVRQRLSEEVRNLVLVSEVGQNFARQQGEANLLESMTRSARILFDFDNAVILLENPTGHALVGMAAGGQQRIAEFSIPLNRGGAVAAAALAKKPAFVKRDAQSLGLAEEQLFRLLGTDSLVCVPLVAGGRSLGVMVGGLGAWQVPACQKRERFMQAFGAQAATALEAALAERGQAHRQLAHAAEEYREASRRVVHEVNNPLSIIKNYLSVLDNKLARREPVVGEMSILNEEIDRVGQLINGLADLQPTATTGATNVARVADDVLRLFRATDFVPAGVAMAVNMPDAGAEIDGDADVLKQILVNLVKNAIEAIGSHGKIDIVNRGHVVRERTLYVDLVVSDNGPGMSQEVLTNLFSPVRSAKEGKHHGLGLSIVHGLVKKIGGIISCRSGAAGTSFEILLPARAPAGAAAGPRSRSMD